MRGGRQRHATTNERMLNKSAKDSLHYPPVPIPGQWTEI